MQTQDEAISLAWPSIALAGLILFGTMIYWGTTAPLENDLAIPYFVRLLAAGASKMPEPWYFIPAIVIGLGCGLSSPNVLTGVRSSLPGIGILALIVTLALFWECAANVSQQIDGESAKIGPFDKYNPGTQAGSLLVLAIGSVGFLLLVAGPLFAGSLAASILLHFTASLLDENHSEWMFDRSQTGAPADRLFDIGAGAVILLFIGWFYFGSFLSFAGDPPTPEEIIAELQPPLDGKTLMETESGRASTRETIRTLGFEFQDTAKDPCDKKRRSWLKTSFQSYYRRIRLIEDWKPGRPLSVFSRQVVDLTRQSLSAGYITWDEIEPYVRVHLDEKRDGAASLVAREKLNCMKKA